MPTGEKEVEVSIFPISDGAPVLRMLTKLSGKGLRPLMFSEFVMFLKTFSENDCRVVCLGSSWRHDGSYYILVWEDGQFKTYLPRDLSDRVVYIPAISYGGRQNRIPITTM
jgi:hypothetical protein